VPIKSLTFTSSTKKLCAKLLYEKAALKMLVKLTPGGICPPGVTIRVELLPTFKFTGKTVKKLRIY
jgi:hypothetical protein